jgi:hypothetical protein
MVFANKFLREGLFYLLWYILAINYVFMFFEDNFIVFVVIPDMGLDLFAGTTFALIDLGRTDKSFWELILIAILLYYFNSNLQ